ncbi:TPA: hypothetical protein ACRN02_006795 [Pseudomonas aeruginosa]
MPTTLLPKPILDGIQRSYSISMLWEGTPANTNVPAERQLLNLVLPTWQREFVWSEEQQRAFVEGIFLGFRAEKSNGRSIALGLALPSPTRRSMPLSGW